MSKKISNDTNAAFSDTVNSNKNIDGCGVLEDFFFQNILLITKITDSVKIFMLNKATPVFPYLKSCNENLKDNP